MKDPKKLLDLLVQQAPALREAGVQRIEYKGDDFIVEFRAADFRPIPQPKEEVKPDADPFEDEWTYGGPGAYVPTFRRPEDPDA